jgi:hypothetical protein
MAEIRSWNTTDKLTIDPTSKAARVTLYDKIGRELLPPPTGAYIAKIEVNHTSAAAANTTQFNLRGPAFSTGLKAYIRNIRGQLHFHGTALAASGTLRYGLYRGYGPVSPSGGTAIAAANLTKKKSSYANSSVTDYRSDLTGVGLTTTGITYDADPIHVFSLPVVTLGVAAPGTSGSHGASIVYDFDMHSGGDFTDIVIGHDQHLAIRIQTVAAIVGFGITGSISWDER